MQIFGINQSYIHIFTYANIHHVDSSRYYAPVNVYPKFPTPGKCGDLVSFDLQIS